MDKNKQSLKATFAEALQNYQKRDFKTAEIFCYKILSINSDHFDSLSLLSNLFAIVLSSLSPESPDRLLRSLYLEILAGMGGSRTHLPRA